jgi:hypothetical protein
MAARCLGSQQLLAADRTRRIKDEEKTRQMSWYLEKRLSAVERSYHASRYAAPASSPFEVPAAFWRVTGEASVICALVGLDTTAAELVGRGWIWTGRGLTVLRDAAGVPLTIEVDAPDGVFQAAAGVVPVESQPWYFGFQRWLRKSFRGTTPASYLPLGEATGRGGRVRVAIPAEIGRSKHIVTLRLTPPGTSHAPERLRDPTLEERLRRLGYVE